MKAVVFAGTREVEVRKVPDAVLEEPSDVVLRVTSSAICRTDLHMYDGRTGGSRGIGLAVVRGLAEAGARVITGAKASSAELDELVRTDPVQSLAVDLSDPGGPGQLTALAGDRIDILVNNVGRAPARRVPGHHRRGLAGLDHAEPDGRGPHHPRRAARDAGRGPGRDR